MYKIIKDNNIIDAVASPQFIKFLSSGHVSFASKGAANGIKGSDGALYSFEPVSSSDIPIVTIEKITSEEFNRLKSLLNSNQEICADESVLASAKLDTVQQLSATCKNKIIEGFSIELSDKRVYNFKLTTEDQINLLNIENRLKSGEENFVYHATGQSCKVFSRKDMIKIIDAYRKLVLYHTTYFNVAKQYINSLTNTKKVISFKYGMDVSNTIKDKNIKQILKGGGHF